MHYINGVKTIFRNYMFIYIIAIPPLPLPSLTPYFYSFTSIAAPTSTSLPFFLCFLPLLLFISVVLPILPSVLLLTYFVFPPYIPPPPPSPPPAHYLPHIYPSPTSHQPLVLARMRWNRNWIALAWLHHPFYAVRRTTQPEPIMISLGFHCQVNFLREKQKNKIK